MSYRRTLVFLVIFAALVSFFYFYEIRGGEARKEAEENSKRIASFKPEEMTTVTITRPQEKIVIRKESDSWNIVEPVKSLAEARKVDQLIEAMADLKFERDLGEQPELSTFGLTEAEAVKIQAGSGGQELASLLLGSATPDGKNFYVRNESGKNIYTAALSAKTQLDQDLFGIRDKKLLNFSTPDVSAVSVSRDGHSLVMEKKAEDEWVITAPVAHDADKEKILDLLNALSGARIKNFVEENASALEPYGLREPVARVELRMEERQAAVSFGRKLNFEAETICAVAGDNRVVEIDASVLEKVVAAPDEWRDKRLTKLDAADVMKVELEKPESRLAFELDDAGNWMMLEPENTRADNNKMDGLLRKVTQAKVAGFAEGRTLEQAKRGLEKPQLRLRLWKEKEEQPAVLSFSRGESGNEWFAATESQSIALITEDMVKELSIEADDFRDKSVINFSAADIEKIEFVKDNKNYVVKRKDVQWDIPRSLKMESLDIDQMLWDLHELKYINKKVKDAPDSAYGFDSPKLQVKLYEAENKNPRKLIFGKEAAEPEILYVYGDDPGTVMEANWEFLTEFVEKF